MATSNEVVVQNAVGLHARPAAVFAKAASTFSSNVQIENLTKGSSPVNGKSVLRLLSAGIQMHDRLRITAEGTDENAAVNALSLLIEANFGETE